MPDSTPPLDLSRRNTALFLDFDGTLVDIVEDPQAVRLPPDRLALLDLLSQRLEGALAVVSGRAIAQLDRFLAPLRLPLAGVHGRERRDAAGRVVRAAADDAAIRDVALRAEAFAAAHPGVIVERKPASVAVHYRTGPRFEAAVLDFAAACAASANTLRLMHGKMVVEIAAGHRTKGDAIADFLREAPFSGRRPVFAGDDVTDEDGFRVVAAHDGVAVKIGDGASAAGWRLDDPNALHRWLAGLERRWR